MFQKNLASILISILFACLFFLLPAQAVSLIPADHQSNCPANYSGNCGDYNVDDFVILAINASQIILGLVGSLTLLMFVYGGIKFLISGGNSQTVEEAKKIITAAVIGLLIVFASFLIIKFVLSSMGINWNGGKIIIASSNSVGITL